MGKFGNYVIIMTGLTLLFHFTGLVEGSPNNILLTLLLDPASFQNTPLALKAIIVFEGILASAVVVGFAFAGNLQLGIMTGFTIYLFNNLWDFIKVYSVIAEANPVIAILFLSPVLFLFVITTIEWWRGITT